MALLLAQPGPRPAEHFFVNATVQIPGLNPDSLSLSVDTLRFEVNGEPTRATFYLRDRSAVYQNRVQQPARPGAVCRRPAIYCRRAVRPARLQLHADGYYRTAVRPGKTRPDTVITAIPAYHLEAGVERGLFQTPGF